jgi:hypothetical protein
LLINQHGGMTVGFSGIKDDGLILAHGMMSPYPAMVAAGDHRYE